MFVIGVVITAITNTNTSHRAFPASDRGSSILPPGAITLSPPVIGYYLPPDSAKANEETLWTAKVRLITKNDAVFSQ